MTSSRAQIAFKIGATFKKNSSQLEEKSKSNGRRVTRTMGGEDVGISVYYCKHNNGILFNYENKSTEYRLIEKVTFELNGCRIEGFRGSSLKITLEPGETDVVRIVPFGGQDWSVRLTSCRYSVVRARWNWSWY